MQKEMQKEMKGIYGSKNGIFSAQAKRKLIKNKTSNWIGVLIIKQPTLSSFSWIFIKSSATKYLSLALASILDTLPLTFTITQAQQRPWTPQDDPLSSTVNQ